jgi:hypothetical protein
VSWYKSGQVSLEYLALSRACLRAMSELSVEDRRDLPGVMKLNAVRISWLTDPEATMACRRVLADDLIALKVRV